MAIPKDKLWEMVREACEYSYAEQAIRVWPGLRDGDKWKSPRYISYHTLPHLCTSQNLSEIDIDGIAGFLGMDPDEFIRWIDEYDQP